MVRRGIAFEADKVLDVNDGGPALVLHQVFRGIDARVPGPASVKLCLEQIGGDSLIQEVQHIAAVEGLELKVMVMVEQLYTRLAAQ